MEKLQLNNLAGGAVEERFNDVLQDVLDNIIDPNTDPKKARKITLTVTFKPNDDRDIAMVEFAAVPSMAPPKPINSSIMIDRDREGKAVAAERAKAHPGQMNIEDYSGEKSKIVQMQK